MTLARLLTGNTATNVRRRAEQIAVSLEALYVMGGKESHEFMVRTPAGEDQIVSCDGCNYAANIEKATSKLDAAA